MRPATGHGFAAAAESVIEDIIVHAGSKEKRCIADTRSKWMHEDLKPEQVDKVKHLCD